MVEESNILCILLDTARTDNLSFYGYDKETMPELSPKVERDEFQKIERCYSTSIWSLPVYGSIFTGELPSEHGAVDWDKSIDSNKLVNLLNNAGYHTEAISTHLVSGGFGIGNSFDELTFISNNDFSGPVFDKFKEKSSKGEYESSAEKYLGFLKIVLEERKPQSLFKGAKALGNKAKARSDKGATELLEKFSDFDFSQEPFFLFTNFIESHFPHKLPKSFLERSDLSQDDLDRINDLDKRKLTVKGADNEEELADIMQKAHDLELEYLDGKIEEMIQKLKDEGVYEETTIILFADHGDVFGESGVWEHMGAITEGLIHVPLLIKPAKGIEIETPGFPVSITQLFDLIETISDGEKSFTFDSKPVFTEYYGLDSQSNIDPAEDFGADAEYWNRYQCAITSWPYRLKVDSLGEINLLNIEESPKNLNIENFRDEIEDLKTEIYEEIGDPKTIYERYREGKILDEVDL